MKDFKADSFGTFYADEYDARHDPGTTQNSVDLIAELAGTGRILELAVGTGRVAIPLAQLGLEVHGIDASNEMLELLADKAGSTQVATSICDIAQVKAPGRFDLAYLVFNTITNLTTQEEQVSCFKSVAEHLNPGGAFLVETFVQDLTQFKDHQYSRTLEVDIDRAMLDMGIHDPTRQYVESQRILITEEGPRMRPLPYRYVWPQELDLMAQLAGMHLEARWGDWSRGPFTKNSKMHVSLYRLD